MFRWPFAVAHLLNPRLAEELQFRGMLQRALTVRRGAVMRPAAPRRHSPPAPALWKPRTR